MGSANRESTRTRRALLVGATLLLVGAPGAALASHVFSDVPHTSPHAPGIAYVAETGVTQGCTPTAYCPSDPLTRAQMGTFLFRASGNDPATPPSVNADRLRGQTVDELRSGIDAALLDGQTADELRSGIDAALLAGEPASAFARASDLPQPQVVTEHVSCVGRGFYPQVSLDYGAVGNTGRFVLGGGSLNGLICPIAPPDGARLVAATFVVGDTSPSQRVTSVSVRRNDLDGGGGVHLGSVGSSLDPITTNAGTPGAVTVQVPIDPSDPATAIVDSGPHTYFLTVSMGPSNPASSEYVSIRGASVAYEIERWPAG